MAINLKILMDYRLFIHPKSFNLCHINDNGLGRYDSSNYKYNEGEKLMCVLKALPDGDITNDITKRIYS